MRSRILLLAVILCLIACDSKRVFEDNVDFKNKYWLVKEPATFEFRITDATHPYNLFYDVRNTIEYPYARLFINYTLTDSTGTELSKKLISSFLFDQKTGRPLGSSGIGDIYDQRFPILENYSFKAAGKYKMKLEQFMRQDTLTGILAVGIRVETVGK